MQKLKSELPVEKQSRIIELLKTPKPSNYSEKEINSLFELKRFTYIQRKLFGCESKAKKLFDLGLSFDYSNYLLQTMKLSVDEIVKYNSYFKFKENVDLIRKLNCSKDVLLTDIPNVISMVGGVEYLQQLIEKGLSIENIKTLFQQLKLSYNDTISLTECGYKVHEIVALIGSKFICSELVYLASVTETSEVYSLFKEERQNLVFLLSVSNILKRKIDDLDSAIECYETLYDSIPNCLCKSLVTISRSVPPVDDTPGADLTYEDILIHYMDLAGGKNMEIANAIPKVFEATEKIIWFFKSSDDDVKFIDEYIPVKPFVLASIWCALDISLGKQYLESSENINAEIVGRSILSFLVSSMCGVTGYFHSGGEGLPFPNVDSFIKKYLYIQSFVKDYAPKVYNKIPQCLLFDTNQVFENMNKEKQISAGQGLSMVYTFRVGNAFLCSLLGNHILSFESAKNIFKSLWPLPQEAESIRMYFIYSGFPIYSKLNLKDVFVSIS